MGQKHTVILCGINNMNVQYFYVNELEVGIIYTIILLAMNSKRCNKDNERTRKE